MQNNQQYKQIMFLQQKYEIIKQNLSNFKLEGSLTPLHLQQLCNLINIIAMKHSKLGNHTLAVQWLRKALKYTQNIPKAKIITYNNLACVYRQQGNFPLALFHITKAQKQADELVLTAQIQGFQFQKGIKVITDCSMNLCAILSSMKEHYKALRIVRKGISLLNRTKQQKKLPNSYYCSLFPLMKYNQGVQLQQLKHFDEAKQCYRESLNIINKDSQIYQKAQKALECLENMPVSSKKSHILIRNKISRLSIDRKMTVKSNASKISILQKNRISGLSYLQTLKVDKLNSARQHHSSRQVGNQQNYNTISYPKQFKNKLQINTKKVRMSFKPIRKNQNILQEVINK